MDTKYSFSELFEDINQRYHKLHIHIIGSFAQAIVEWVLYKKNTIQFEDIDFLFTPFNPLFLIKERKYFREKYSLKANYGVYSTKYIGIEEVVQESSLFLTDRVFIYPKNRQIIYDGNSFESLEELYKDYINKNFVLNEDCCIYHYRTEEQNLKRLNKFGIQVPENISDYIHKQLMYTDDKKYIESFKDNASRYTIKPKILYKTKVAGSIPYYDIKKKFIKCTYKY